MQVCIVGTSRCGTTLLRNLLDRHPSIGLFNETHWIPKMYEFYGTQRVHWKHLFDIAEKTTWDTGRDLFSVNAEITGYGNRDEVIRDFSLALKKKGKVNIQEFNQILAEILFPGTSMWGDKTPDYGFYMGLIQQLWPECRFVHMVRDGLSTALSMSGHSGCMLMVSNGYDNWCSLSYDHIYERYSVLDLPMESYVASWVRRLQRIRDEAQRLKEGSYLEMRYEALLKEPKKSLIEVVNFLGLDSPHDWLDLCAGEIRPKATIPPDIDLLLRLSYTDLVQINELDESGYFLLPWDAKDDATHALIEEIKNMPVNNIDERTRGVLSILATRACAMNYDMLRTANDMRHKITEVIIQNHSSST
jgi:hypothetical protein